MAISHWYWCGIGVVGFISLVAVIYFSVKIILKWRKKAMLQKWSQITRDSDILIVHIPPNAKTIPNASPYVMKVLTFLRMARISYKVDNSNAFGGKGKTPWISIGGVNVDDSEMIIFYLTWRYTIYLNSQYSEEKLAVATAVRIMLDEHMSWGLALERFVYGKKENLLKVVAVPKLLIPIIRRVIKKRSEDQGIGHHTPQDVLQIIKKDLQVVSRILGKKTFICGSLPCTEDAGIFGQLSQFYWGLPNSPYRKLLNGELRNLRDYCERIRDIYWPELNV